MNGVSKTVLALALALMTTAASARDSGVPSATDQSVRIYTYAREQVYELTGAFGITTQIWIGADEKIESAQSGDSEAWDISVPESRDYVAVKPIVKPPRPTNLVIYTNKRVYQFALSAEDEGDVRNATFTARFQYPNTIDSIDALSASVARTQELEAALERERQVRADLTRQYDELQTGYETKEAELARQLAEEERAERLAALQERLTYEERSRLDLQQDRDELQRQLDAIQSAKDQQVFEVMEARLRGAQDAESASQQRISELEGRLAAFTNEKLARDQAALERELRDARSNRTALAEARERLAALEAQREAERRRAQSSVVFDAFAGGRQGQGGAGDSGVSAATYRDTYEPPRDDDRAYLETASTRGFDVAEAAQLNNLDSKVLQGAILSGTLETAIDSQLSGMVRAVLSEPIWAADGSRILADRGSRLVGEYRSFVRFGNDRVLVAWNRLITADGVSVDLGSPGIDGLGRAGFGGYADSQFEYRFGAAALISIMGGLSALAVSEATDELTNETAGNVADDSEDAFERVLSPYLDLPTIVHVDQGTPIKVFVARDLDFSRVR